jgi:general secretion pathway protein F
MSDFDYLALDTAGRERRGSVKAASVEDARASLSARKLYVVRMERSTGATAPPLLSRSLLLRKKLSAKQLTLFTRQLATLVQVSPMEESLRTIGRQAEKERVRSILLSVHAGVVEGRRLSEAMTREAASFPPLYRAMVAAGESSGTLPRILDRLADLLERQAQVRSKVTSALAYPIILAIVASFVVMALMIFVVPRVVEQFEDVGQELPLLTRIVIGLSEFLANWWWALALALVGFALLLGRALQEETLRLRFDRSLLRVPLLGRLLRDLHAARMARTLSTMVASRLPLLEGLQLTTQTVHNRALRAASGDITEAIRTGGSLSAALRRAAVFPPLLVYMAASGEAAGKLDIMLEPAIIVVMGGVVALIVLSILLPILQLDTLAGGMG